MKDKLGNDIKPGDFVAVSFGSQSAHVKVGWVDRVRGQRIYLLEPSSREEYAYLNKHTLQPSVFVDPDAEYMKTGRRIFQRPYFVEPQNRLVKLDESNIAILGFVDSDVAYYLEESYGKKIKRDFINQV